MRSRVLFIFVLVSACLAVSPHLLGQRQAADGQMSLRQKIDSEVSNLLRNLDRVKTPSDKMRDLEKTEHHIQSLRQKGARQDEPDEIYFDKLLSGLLEIPRAEQFQIGKCPDYQSLLITRLNPKASEDANKDPALKQSLAILSALCGKPL